MCEGLLCWQKRRKGSELPSVARLLNVQGYWVRTGLAGAWQLETLEVASLGLKTLVAQQAVVELEVPWKARLYLLPLQMWRGLP